MDVEAVFAGLLCGLQDDSVRMSSRRGVDLIFRWLNSGWQVQDELEVRLWKVMCFWKGVPHLFSLMRLGICNPLSTAMRLMHTQEGCQARGAFLQIGPGTSDLPC